MHLTSRRAFAALALSLVVACGSSSDEGGSSSSSSSSGAAAGGKAQLRFKNTTGTSWLEHVAAGKSQVSGFTYTITIGQIPTPIRFALGTLADGAATDYQSVDAATYKDANILHSWSFNYNKGTGSTYVGGSESKELYSKLGIDLVLEADKKYTVELGATASKLTPDP